MWLAAGANAYVLAKFYLDPRNHLATIHERHRQDRQRSDGIGRTVLETVAQKVRRRNTCELRSANSAAQTAAEEDERSCYGRVDIF